MPLPLAGKRIAVTRAAEQSGELTERLGMLGATVQHCPLIAIAPPEDAGPLDAALARLAAYDWLMLTSANAVRACFARMDAGLPQSLTVGAVGPATARALAEFGIVAGFLPRAYTAEAMLAELGDMAGQRVLLPAADIARETLAAGLRGRGAQVDVVTAYRTVPGDGVATLRGLLADHALDAVTFASPSAVRALLDGMPLASRTALADVALICIGPTTAAAARELGLPVAATAQAHTAAGLVEALGNWGTGELGN